MSDIELPHLKHDCSACVFLGRHSVYDLYYHGGHNILGATLIVRWGDECSHYGSGMTLGYSKEPHCASYREALERARKLGLISEEMDAYYKLAYTHGQTLNNVITMLYAYNKQLARNNNIGEPITLGFKSCADLIDDVFDLQDTLELCRGALVDKNKST